MNLSKQFNSLPEHDRNGKTWEQIEKYLPADFEERIKALEEPRVLKLDYYNTLILCDGGDEVPKETLRKNYYDCEKLLKDKGLEMMTDEEWFHLQNQSEKKYEAKNCSWIKSNVIVGDARVAIFDPSGQIALVGLDAANSEYDVRGVRRLLRVSLKLDSQPSLAPSPSSLEQEEEYKVGMSGRRFFPQEEEKIVQMLQTGMENSWRMLFLTNRGRVICPSNKEGNKDITPNLKSIKPKE